MFDAPPPNIVLCGPPGSGKGTLSQWLVTRLKIKHFSTGEILRNHIEKQSPIGKIAKTYIDSGQLVPDKQLGRIIQTVITDHKDKGFILDGYPRNLEQARFLMQLTRIDVVLNLICPVDIIKQRMMGRGRADDQESVIENRVRVYEKQTAPVLEYFKNCCDYIITIDGSGTIEGTQEILNGVIMGHQAFADIFPF